MLPVLDEERLRSITRNDTALARELLDMMIGEATGLASVMRACCAEHDRAGLREAVHSIRGVAGSVGARALHAAASALEAAVVETPADWSTVPALCEAVGGALDGVTRLRDARARELTTPT